jgi:5'-3' exonuclease
LSERYPKINQRYGSPPNPETSKDYFGDQPQPPPQPFEQPDPLSQCGLAPEIDRLYLDMNGILHGCSHNNNAGSDNDGGDYATSNRITNDQIFNNVCYYLDRVVSDMVQPKQVVYMAIDGVAPRAKLNQQRSRRYRSGTEGQIETNIYDAHLHAKEKERLAMLDDYENSEEDNGDNDVVDDGYSFVASNNHHHNNEDLPEDLKTSTSSLWSKDHDHDSDAPQKVQEISPGRFKGKFQTQAQMNSDQEAFHSNVITPGTPFFQAFTSHLEHFVKRKLSQDPKWQHLTIIFSGPNVPGEGEHKIMQFIRQEKERPNYNPNLRHCIMGQDGDLVMLGLATHEPNMVLLRERVIFNMTTRRLMEASQNGSLDTYIHNPHFEFLHMGVLRDYLAYEFETSNVIEHSAWDLERTLDDFVFMTFTGMLLKRNVKCVKKWVVLLFVIVGLVVWLFVELPLTFYFILN